MTIRVTEEQYLGLIKGLENNRKGARLGSGGKPDIIEKNCGGGETPQGKRLSLAISNASGKGKYRNKICFFDNIRFQSGLERDRYIILKDMQAKGEILDLRTQVRFDFPVNDMHICFYLADFTYYKMDGTYCVEDTKGKKTNVYEIKKALMKAIHNIEISEIYAKKKTRKSR